MNRLHAFFLFLALAAAATAAAAAASFSASGTGPSVVLSISHMTCTSWYSHVRTSFFSFLRPVFRRRPRRVARPSQTLFTGTAAWSIHIFFDLLLSSRPLNRTRHSLAEPNLLDFLLFSKLSLYLPAANPQPLDRCLRRNRSIAAASWDTASHRSYSSSDEQYMTMSREFTAMVAAGATMQTGPNASGGGGYDNGSADHLTSIGEDELEETNPLAIVPDSHPIATPARSRASGLEVVPAGPAPPQPPAHVEASQVKKEEVETKVTAWQTAEVAKINNRFKREEVVINGWETEQVEKASAWLKKIERKLDEQRAKALEKTQNDIAKARRKAEEKRASAEAKRGLKLAKVLELANFMKAVGRVPTKRSFF